MKATTLLVAGLAIVMATGTARAATSVQSGNWNSTDTWGGSVPGALEDVVVAAGHSVTVDVATAALNSFTNNGALVFIGWNNKLTATEVSINGTITHLPQSDITGTIGVYADWTPDNRVWLVCSNLTVTGAINANDQGYQPGAVLYKSGRGPGGGPYTTSSSTQGAGHGGVAYGLLTEPEDPGSSGGTGYQYPGNTGIGGAGGGAIRIEASGAVIVDGVITVNGQASGSDHSGGGSGGSIYMTCATIGGTGTLSACGGNVNGVANGTSSAGAGGRIAIVYQPGVQQLAPAHGLKIRLAAGLYSNLGNLSEDGTARLPDTLLFKPWITDVLQGVRLFGVTNWAVDSLTASGASVIFAESNFLLRVTNTISVLGAGGRFSVNSTNLAFTCQSVIVQTGRLEMIVRDFEQTGASDWTINGGRVDLTSRTLAVNQSLILQNSANLRVSVPATNDSIATFGCDVTVGGDITLGSGCWIYPASHPTNGSSVRFIATNVFLSTNSGFNATGLGYRGGRVAGERGYGPGGTPVGGNNTSGGAGYGGNGGDSRKAAINGTGFGGPTYGSAQFPDAPGSGGGAGYSAYIGGDGGGLVRIVAAGTVTVNGQILANGTYSGSSHSGGGSGGGVYIACQVFAGTGGVIQAIGGNSGSDGDGAPGAGGRIAVKYDVTAQNAMPIPTVLFQASPGSGHSYLLSYNSLPIFKPEPGTLYLPDNRFLLSAITDRFRDVRFCGWNAWSTPLLTISNNAVHFIEPNFVLAVAGDVWIKGAGALSVTNNGSLTVGGNVTLTNTASLHVQNVTGAGGIRLESGTRLNAYAFITNGVGTNFGALVQFAGDVVVASNAWIVPVSHPTNGASSLFRVNSLTLSGGTNGGINARGQGFQGGRWYGTLSAGRGPGGGGAAVGNSGAGGGYGGIGGKARSATGGGTYGSELQPVDPGSGGGRCSSFNGGDGGGLVRFEIERKAIINGMIDARGTHIIYDHDGGGAGGGIYLRCRSISGSGSLLADGGGMTGINGGNGGGGRIAVYFVQGLNTFSGSASVSPTYTITPAYTPYAGTGTVHWVAMPGSGSLMLIR